ncbi:MAG TPA: glycosyl hydrolase 108 family protein [Nevskia sp.]|jgi:lysozyme family protein|nr:glycosyl hydrolase 108 family protein [Nevskia sp.]
MAATTYDTALRRLLTHEGGYTNHPDDPGGPTNFGITIADYRRYVKPDATADDVRAMPLGEAESIYRRRYWDAQRCDDLPAGIDYAVFDYGVNSGVGRSAKVLRRVLRLANTSSKVTDEVVAAARAGDACEIVAAICDERLRFLKSLKTWDVFGKGWERRVTEVKFAALAMAQPRAAASAAPAKAGGAIVAAGGAAATAHQANLPPFVVLAIAAAAAVAAAVVVHFVTRQKG